MATKLTWNLRRRIRPHFEFFLRASETRRRTAFGQCHQGDWRQRRGHGGRGQTRHRLWESPTNWGRSAHQSKKEKKRQSMSTQAPRKNSLPIKKLEATRYPTNKNWGPWRRRSRERIGPITGNRKISGATKAGATATRSSGFRHRGLGWTPVARQGRGRSWQRRRR